MIDPFGDLPITVDKISSASLIDPDIAMVLTAVQHGHWPQPSLNTPYYRCHHELTAIYCELED